MQITDSDFTRPEDEYSSYFGCLYDVLVVSDDQTTANMDPCTMVFCLTVWTLPRFLVGKNCTFRTSSAPRQRLGCHRTGQASQVSHLPTLQGQT